MRRILGLMVVLAAGCGPDGRRIQVAYAETSPASGSVVDSVFPMDVMIARFQGEAPRKPEDFGTAAATTQEELIERLVHALADSSEVTLHELVLDVSEFAFLYFPTSKLAVEPYRQPPSIGWMLTEQNGLKGRQRALAVYGGKDLTLGSYACATGPVTEGDNRLWPDCTVKLKGATESIRLFGTIIERGGRFKFVSLSNDL